MVSSIRPASLSASTSVPEGTVGPWDSEGLYRKAQLYVERANQEPPDGPMRAHWAVLALELLARSSLARRHQVLLADPREPNSILHAFGVGTPRPRSIAAHTVFSRCRALFEGFSERDEQLATALANRRNEELHTATSGFEAFPSRLWLAGYYRLLSVLLPEVGRSLDDFLGDDEGRAAQTILDSSTEATEKEVRRAIADARVAFEARTASSQADMALVDAAGLEAPRLGTVVSCPACGQKAIVRGERVTIIDRGTDENGDVELEHVMLPTSLACPTCGLTIDGHGQLNAVELGGQYGWIEYVDPIEHYSLEVEHDRDYGEYLYEEEYDNE